MDGSVSAILCRIYPHWKVALPRDGAPLHARLSCRQLTHTSSPSSLLGEVPAAVLLDDHAVTFDLFLNGRLLRVQRNDLGAVLQPVQVVGPDLHHLAAFGKKCRAVVSAPVRIADGMR